MEYHLIEIRFLLYKAGIDGKYLDNGIAGWTQLINSWRLLNAEQRKIVLAGYSHAEVWVPSEDGCFGGVYMNGTVKAFAGDCYTSTLGQIRNPNVPAMSGTCKRPASQILRHPERWDIVKVLITQEQYNAMIEYLDYEVDWNQGYGKRDCLKFFGLGFLSSPHQNICSELVHNAGVTAEVLKGEFNIVSPLLLAILLVQAGHKIKRLTA